MMVKIGVIFMPFSNPTCHFRATADFTVCTVCTWCHQFFSLRGQYIIWATLVPVVKGGQNLPPLPWLNRVNWSAKNWGLGQWPPPLAPRFRHHCILGKMRMICLTWPYLLILRTQCNGLLYFLFHAMFWRFFFVLDKYFNWRSIIISQLLSSI